MHALLAMTDDLADRATRRNVESELAIEQQLAKLLVELIDRGLGEPANDGVLLRFNIATLVGAKKPRLRQEDHRPPESGHVVATGRQSVTITQPDALRDIADGNLMVT